MLHLITKEDTVVVQALPPLISTNLKKTLLFLVFIVLLNQYWMVPFSFFVTKISFCPFFGPLNLKILYIFSKRKDCLFL